MAKKKDLDNFIKNFSIPVVDNGILNDVPETKHVTKVTAPTVEEEKALMDKRNSKRGRKPAGAPTGGYKRVGFECSIDILKEFDMIPYKTGKMRRELFEEALEYIIQKYN